MKANVQNIKNILKGCLEENDNYINKYCFINDVIYINGQYLIIKSSQIINESKHG